MNQGIKLTLRDRDLLYDCYSHTVMSFSQLHGRHFSGKSISTVSNRLGALKRAGFLKRYRVGMMLLQKEATNEIGVVYQLTRKGHTFLKTSCPDNLIRDEPPQLNLPSLAHDLLLNDVLSALKKRFPEKRLVHGKLFPIPTGGGIRHPDAIIVGQAGEGNVAVELELTAKSESRYRTIVVQYLTTLSFKKVLYVVGGKTISDKIKFQITHQKSPPGLPEPSTGKFYFVTLSDLLRDPKGPLISNGSSITLLP